MNLQERYDAFLADKQLPPLSADEAWHELIDRGDYRAAAECMAFWNAFDLKMAIENKIPEIVDARTLLIACQAVAAIDDVPLMDVIRRKRPSRVEDLINEL